MRRINRVPLAADLERKLKRKQATADRKQRAGTLQVNAEWQKVRRSDPLRQVFVTLRRMTGERERCMYCLDSHGTDIEHFWPKAHYPERMFRWPNLLLCCSGCGRLKGDRFPLSPEAQPLLIDPTVEDPWLYLDFDPATGNVTARFDVSCNDWSDKGLKTVELLQLDRREALAAGYRKTCLRLVNVVKHHLTEETAAADDWLAALRDADDHGLLGWCFSGTGRDVSPFREWREQYPDIWVTCAATFDAAGE